jgi:hypothetical protein
MDQTAEEFEPGWNSVLLQPLSLPNQGGTRTGFGHFMSGGMLATLRSAIG